MKNRLLAGALIALGAPFLASAQCPAGQTPDTIFLNKTFTFRVTNARVGAIGNVTFLPNGYLNVVETVIDVSGANGNAINRLAPASGRWLVNANCTSGQIQIMLNREFFTLNFTATTVAGVTTLTLSGRDENFPNAPALPLNPRCPQSIVPPPTTSTGLPIPTPCPNATPPDPAALTGTALSNTLKACPPGLGNPLNLLKGTRYNYTLSGTAGFGDRTASFGESGSFVATFNNPFAYSGDLLIDNRIVNIVPGPTTPTGNPPAQPTPFPSVGSNGINLPFWPNYVTQGRFIIYNDCSGGELMFMANGYAVQLEFVFSKPDFSQMYLLMDERARIFIPAGPGNNPPAVLPYGVYSGVANKV